MSENSDWGRLRLGIELLSKAVGDEILRYPAPIPACDAHFNHLLELRRLLPTELSRLDAATENSTITVADFIRSSPCRDTLSELMGKPASAAP